MGKDFPSLDKDEILRDAFSKLASKGVLSNITTQG